jgi:hypothetical protein
MNMSFGRLLAAGRSLIGLRTGESRYRENKQARLPKFISPKNPFAPAGNNSVPTVAMETTEPVITTMPAAEKPAPLKAQPAPASARRANWLGGWRGKLNPFGSRGSMAKPAKGVAGAARQGELALERVQVVRNDLSDAEGKAGPPQPKAVPGLPGMSMTMGKLEPVGAAWHRLAAKFIGTDQT